MKSIGTYLTNRTDRTNPSNLRRACVRVAGVLYVLAAVAGCGREGGREADQGVASVPEEKPNIVLVILDTLRADKLGCYGFPRDTSPEIDALAAEGVAFERVIAPCSWTRPSIGAMLTGRYPRSLGLYKEIGEVLPDDAETLAEALREAGYATFCASANPNVNAIFGFDQGFDEYRDSHVVWRWMQASTGDTAAAPAETNPLPSARELYDWVLSEAARPRSGPCFVQIITMEMHEYGRGPLSLTRPEFGSLFEGERDAEYLRALRQTSQDLAAFLEALRRLPGWENTLAVIASDHGEGLSDHPHVDKSTHHGNLLYESMIHVPLIVWHPAGALAPRRVAEQVGLIDLMPTLLAYVDLPVPSEADGVSLLPLVRGTGDVLLPEYRVSETYLRAYEKIAAHGADWHYIESRDTHPGVDPIELQETGTPSDGVLTNRIREHEDAAEAMRGFLQQWEAEHREQPPAFQAGELSEEEIEQLRAAGYLGS